MIQHFDATKAVLSTSLVCLMLTIGVSGYISVSSPKLSSEQLSYAAWYSKVADKVRALLVEKSDKLPEMASLGKRIRNMSRQGQMKTCFACFSFILSRFDALRLPAGRDAGGHLHGVLELFKQRRAHLPGL